MTAFDLDWLLHPITVPDFLRSGWEERPVLITRGIPDYFADLPGLDAVDELITATNNVGSRPRSNVRVVRSDQTGKSSELDVLLPDSRTPDIQAVYRAYHEGYSVVVNGLHHRSAVVADLSRGLEGVLHHPVGVNLYLTPPCAQGFMPHVDNHDVFILQLHGVKHWHVGTPPKELPLVSTEQGATELGDFAKFILTPGDLLYLPRGFPHEAVTSESSSLHLTVGVHAYRWVDLMTEALGVLADDDVSLRGALPPGFLDGSLEPAHLGDLLTRLTSAIEEGSLAERAKLRLSKKLLMESKAVGSGHFRSLDAISSLTGQSVVVRNSSLFCRVRSDSEQARIEFATNFVAGPAILQPALRFVADRQRFAVSEIPGPLSADEKLDLVSRLISEGLLQVVRENQGGGN